MRIVVWNCNMALDRKLDALRTLRPDVAILPEVATPETLAKRGVDELAMEWMGGDNHNKGLGVAVFGDSTLTRRASKDFPYVLPVHVQAEARRFGLLGVWARHKKRPAESNGRIGPLLLALDAYGPRMLDSEWVVAGDFNNHVRWDRPGKLNNHMNAVRTLEDLGLVSAYHAWHEVGYGDEIHSTHYWRDRKRDGWRYHIDYCFIPESWVSGLQEVRVGTFEEWVGSGLSDHVPVIVDVDLGKVGTLDRAS